MTDGPHYAEFSLRHPLIFDPKLKEFEAKQQKQEKAAANVASSSQ